MRKGISMSVAALTLLLGSSLAHASIDTAPTVGLKNFREILASLEAVTKIPAKTGTIPTISRKVSSRLPVRGEVEELGSPTVLALVELTGAFCSELILSETKAPSASDREFFYDADFTKGPSQFTPAVWNSIVNVLANKFWQRDPLSTEYEQFKTLLGRFQTEGPEDKAKTIQALQAACVTAGSSLAFLINGI